MGLVFQKQKRKSWICLFKEFQKLNNTVEVSSWLEKNTLDLKKRNKGISFSGAKFLIKENLTALLHYYGPKEKEKVKKYLGTSKRVFK